MSPQFSIIIPTLNEAAQIGRTLEPLLIQDGVEVLVADGGSMDRTPTLAAALGARVLQVSPGKARQMNEAARNAQGEILLFLHADTQLPPTWKSDVLNLLQNKRIVAGAFRLGIDRAGLAMRVIEAAANLRSTYLSIPYGDQALFLETRLFRELGGFREIPIMEDFELVVRLRRHGRIGIAPSAVRTSGRRWRDKGVVRTTLLNWAIVTGYVFGMSPGRLARWYRG